MLTLSRLLRIFQMRVCPCPVNHAQLKYNIKFSLRSQEYKTIQVSDLSRGRRVNEGTALIFLFGFNFFFSTRIKNTLNSIFGWITIAPYASIVTEPFTYSKLATRIRGETSWLIQNKRIKLGKVTKDAYAFVISQPNLQSYRNFITGAASAKRKCVAVLMKCVMLDQWS